VVYVFGNPNNLPDTDGLIENLTPNDLLLRIPFRLIEE